jgi:hypothetical protein
MMGAKDGTFHFFIFSLITEDPIQSLRTHTTQLKKPVSATHPYLPTVISVIRINNTDSLTIALRLSSGNPGGKVFVRRAMDKFHRSIWF